MVDDRASSDDTFWKLAEQRAGLARELAHVTRADGTPRGFTILGWNSRKRKQSQWLRLQLVQVEDRLAASRDDIVRSLRAEAADAVSGTVALRSLAKKDWPADTDGEFSKLRHAATQLEHLARGEAGRAASTAALKRIVAQSRKDQG